MTNKKILQQAIGKAVKNGWDISSENGLFEMIPFGTDDPKLIAEANKNSSYNIIFSHDFAKAFWGERKEVSYDEDIPLSPTEFTEGCELGKKSVLDNKWQYHLQQMVISDDPIKYLEEFLD